MNKSILLVSILCASFLLFSPVSRAQFSFATQDFYPFNYKDKHVVSGPAADIIREVCHAMEMSCSFQLMNWLRAQWFVEHGRKNGLFVIGWNEERSKIFYFSPPIIDTEYGIFVRKDNPLKFTKETDILDYHVGVYGPSNTEKSLLKIKENINKLAVSVTNDDERQFQNLSDGKVDAVYSNRDVGYALINKLELDNIRYAGMHRQLKYYIGFAKAHNSASLIKRFNDTLIKLYQQGKLNGVYEKYDMQPPKDLVEAYKGLN
ncbi:substrate-binding periplasmic protein [Dongshaea marina]|uniref:substrate-binding periplasmic protein n=1 Tax=Dongshaea marina TaxID=2047966 RepID=UPI00131ED37F|nr:transporter substrate-binding domain-containing protein [Dongshaea marina]